MTDEPLTRSARQAETRTRLLDAALEVFSARGFHGASVEAIAREAGFTKGAVYANFEGKEALFLAVVDRRMDEQIARTRAQEAAELRGEDPSADLVQCEIETSFEVGWALMAYEAILYAVRESPTLRAELAERFRRVDEWTTAYLERKGADPPEFIPALAVAQGALGEGLMLRRLVDPERITTQVINDILETVFDPPQRRAWHDAPQGPADPA